MWFIIKYIIISICVIVVLHYLVQYLKDTFTIKKIKYTSSEIEKYKQIIYEIQEKTAHPTNPTDPLSLTYLPTTTTHTDFFSDNTKSELMNDLDSFLISSTAEEQQIDALTKYNTQNNINISFETI